MTVQLHRPQGLLQDILFTITVALYSWFLMCILSVLRRYILFEGQEQMVWFYPLRACNVAQFYSFTPFLQNEWITLRNSCVCTKNGVISPTKVFRSVIILFKAWFLKQWCALIIEEESSQERRFLSQKHKESPGAQQDYWFKEISHSELEYQAQCSTNLELTVDGPV